ncbi:MAG: hypothetical protein ABW096_12105 [Candidatus Thiodiazotropha sp.]
MAPVSIPGATRFDALALTERQAARDWRRAGLSPTRFPSLDHPGGSFQ